MLLHVGFKCRWGIHDFTDFVSWLSLTSCGLHHPDAWTGGECGAHFPSAPPDCGWRKLLVLNPSCPRRHETFVAAIPQNWQYCYFSITLKCCNASTLLALLWAESREFGVRSATACTCSFSGTRRESKALLCKPQSLKFKYFISPLFSLTCRTEERGGGKHR